MNGRPLQHLLFVTAPRSDGHLSEPKLADALRQPGTVVDVVNGANSVALAEAVSGTCSGQDLPADVILLDLGEAPDLLVLQHLRRLEWTALGGRACPLLALIRERHLTQPELTTLIDDFLLPPFRLTEVLARLALMQNRRGTELRRILKIADLEIDIVERQVRTEDHADPLALTPREHDLLAFLAVHQGQTFTRKMLLEHVWGRAYEGGPRTVDIHVRRLREKLPPPSSDCLETVRHIGYRLRDPSRSRRNTAP